MVHFTAQQWHRDQKCYIDKHISHVMIRNQRGIQYKGPESVN